MSENKKKNLELFVFVLTAAVHRSGSFKQWDTSAQDFSKTSRSENCCCGHGRSGKVVEGQGRSRKVKEDQGGQGRSWMVFSHHWIDILGEKS